MPRRLRSVGVIDLVVHAAQARSAHYREKAVQLREMAGRERAGKLRDNLLELADKYDGLADSKAAAETG